MDVTADLESFIDSRIRSYSGLAIYEVQANPPAESPDEETKPRKLNAAEIKALLPTLVVEQPVSELETFDLGS